MLVCIKTVHNVIIFSFYFQVRFEHIKTSKYIHVKLHRRIKIAEKLVTIQIMQLLIIVFHDPRTFEYDVVLILYSTHNKIECKNNTVQNR